MTRRLRMGKLLANAVLLTTVLARQAVAVPTGEVGVPPRSTVPSLDDLVGVVTTPPGPELTLRLAPTFSYEKFDEYTEEAKESGGVRIAVESPAFTIDTTGFTAGANYLFSNGLLVGASFIYNHANYDFKAQSRAEGGRNFDPEVDFFLGQPLDRKFDEYGAGIGVGYLKDPWTIIFSGGYSYRDIEMSRREFNGPGEVVETAGNTDAHLWNASLGISYKFKVHGGSIQPLASIAYQWEKVNGYTEEFDSAFQATCIGRSVTGDCIDWDFDFRAVREDDTIASTAREFNQQTIESVPLQLGLLLLVPLPTSEGDAAFRSTTVGLGATFTHDFADQRRKIKSESLEFEEFDIVYEEKNRNRNYISVVASWGFDLYALKGEFAYNGDVGFDERERAHVFSLQLQLPLSW